MDRGDGANLKAQRSPFAVVLIVFFIVTGIVLVAKTGGMREQPSREAPRPCIERIER